MLWVACTGVVVLAAVYILAPLFRETKDALDIELLAETELDRLLDRKAVVYRNLKDLELEYKMGRLSDADFEQLGAGYKSEAAQILQKLDHLEASENLDDLIERDIASHKAPKPAAGKRRSQETLKCPACGAEVIPGKKFCADCGHSL